MITLEQFMALKQGDVVVFHTKKSGSYMRTVITGPADSGYNSKAITIPKICRSWTRRATTIYFWHEIKDRATIAPCKNKHLINTFEHERLLKQGLNPRRELVREFQEVASSNKWKAEHGFQPRVCQFKIKRISKVS